MMYAGSIRWQKGAYFQLESALFALPGSNPAIGVLT